MTPAQGESLTVHILRKNGAVAQVFTDLEQAENYMKLTRKNGEFWRIQSIKTAPHKEHRNGQQTVAN